MPALTWPTTPPSQSQLDELMSKAQRLRQEFRDGQSEVRLPIGFEFAGSPKAGKSTIIGLISLFFRRAGFRVSLPPEGASIETPPDLKDDLLAFNVWCGCYAIQNILVRSHEGDPPDLLILDRGLFDLSVWMEFLHSREQLVDQGLRDVITNFALAPYLLRREHAIFLLTCNASTALERERHSQLTTKPGRAMNEATLREIVACYQDVAQRESGRLPELYEADTSTKDGTMTNFQSVAFAIAGRMLGRIELATSQILLVTAPLQDHGFITDTNRVTAICDAVLTSPKFMPRKEAESSLSVQQVVPYAFLVSSDNKFLCVRRRSNDREALRSKLTMLFGGHAEQRDWESGPPAGVFRRCLERELEEELIGISVKSATLRGVVNDLSNGMGSKHLALIHEVHVGGRAAIRRQTSDREFGREAPHWRTREEILQELDRFDPWSQLVASGLFGVKLDQQDEPGLFLRP